MFVLVIYDVPADRTHLYRKLLRRRLQHLQQSVFYGNITAGQLVAIKTEIEETLIDDDSVIVFEAEAVGFVDHTVYGSSDEPGTRFT